MEARSCYTASVKAAAADPKGKRTAEEAELGQGSAFTVEGSTDDYELDPHLLAQ